MQCCQQGDQQQIDFRPNELPSDHPVWPPDLDTSSSNTGTSTAAWSEQVQQCQVLDQKLMEHIWERPKRWNKWECKKGDEMWLTRKRNPWRQWQLAWTKYHTLYLEGEDGTPVSKALICSRGKSCAASGQLSTCMVWHQQLGVMRPALLSALSSLWFWMIPSSVTYDYAMTTGNSIIGSRKITRLG